MRQTIAAALIFFLIFYGISAAAMPKVASQVCHSACSSPSSIRAAPVSFTTLHSFAPAFRFISPRSLLIYCCKGMGY
jgi:hypothetical protein